ncbi:MAG: nucleotidyltransferase domain-containing protein [Bacteroidetes bacterium]|nr:nucleotidyltransferase domain-containing protein [Bacteroidota bacterium]
MHLNHKQIGIISDYFKGKPVQKAFLFGSYARGKARKDSDIDLLVELDYSKPIGLEFIQMQLDLEGLLDQKVDLVSENGLSKYIRPFVDAEKVIIYDKKQK